MNFETSTQRRRWLRVDDSSTLGLNGESDDPEPKKALIVRSCASKVVKIGRVLKYSRSVVLTAIAYIRRYFAVEPIVGADLSLTIITALYLAGKVEEVPPSGPLQINQRGVDMDELCNIVKTKKRSAEALKTEAIRNEMKLLVGLGFDLLCFHPLRPALGYLDELKKIGNGSFPIELSIAIETTTWSKCVGCYLVDDLIFKFPSSFLGAVSVFSAIRALVTVPDQRNSLLHTFLDVIRRELEQAPERSRIEQRLHEIADQLDAGMLPERDKEADTAYDEFFKRPAVT